MPIEKILITGASGYLARFIIDRLQGAYQLTLTDIVEPEHPFPDTTFIQADVTNPPEIEAACARTGCRGASGSLGAGTVR